jgi:hypothetical protein
MAEEYTTTQSQIDESLSTEIAPKKKRFRMKKKVDPRKWLLSQGYHEPLLYRSLKSIYADAATHGLRRHQIKTLKKLSDQENAVASRLGELRQRTKEERLIPVISTQ